MKGNKQILDRLNSRLADELTAINQYMVHSEMCANWGYDRLHAVIEKRAIDEMKHAEKLIARILFLEGRPQVGQLNKINIGQDIPNQLRQDCASETEAIQTYNEDMALAVKVGDNGTRELLESILKDEEAHLDWLEAQLDQLDHLGLQHYLSGQRSPQNQA
jgi:bacterioferritin